jgi:hypothetical protein
MSHSILPAREHQHHPNGVIHSVRVMLFSGWPAAAVVVIGALVVHLVDVKAIGRDANR